MLLPVSFKSCFVLEHFKCNGNKSINVCYVSNFSNLIVSEMKLRDFMCDLKVFLRRNIAQGNVVGDDKKKFNWTFIED